MTELQNFDWRIVMKITIHGFSDWEPTKQEFIDMLNTVQIGANQDCDVTIGVEKKTIKEWQQLDVQEMDRILNA